MSQVLDATGEHALHDDAPRELREALFADALLPFLRVEGGHFIADDPTLKQARQDRPILCSSLTLQIAKANGIAPPQFYRNPVEARKVLRAVLLTLSAERYWDVLVAFSRALAELDRVTGQEHAKRFRAAVNRLFRAHQIGLEIVSEHRFISTR